MRLFAGQRVSAFLKKPFTSIQLAEKVKAFKVGRGTEPGVELGPMIDAKQRDKVAELVGDALERGASPLTGGKAVAGPGYFYEPTVLGGVQQGTRLLTEEVFGPVAPVISFSGEADCSHVRPAGSDKRTSSASA